MKQQVYLSLIAPYAIDEIENLNPEICEKMKEHQEGFRQLLEIEGVRGCIYPTYSIIIQDLKGKFVTREQLDELHEKHERIVETVSQWKIPKDKAEIERDTRKTKSKETPFQMLCNMMDTDTPLTDGIQKLDDAISESLGFDTGISFVPIMIDMQYEYRRRKENKKEL